MRNKVLRVTLLLAMFIAMMLPIPVRGQTNTYLRVVPSKTTVSAGETFTVDIGMVPSSAVAGIQFSLTFNPSALTVNSITEGNVLKQGGASTYFVQGTIDNVLGAINNVADVITTPGQTVSAQGVIATLSCTAKTAGSTSNFALSNVIVGNKDGVALPLAVPVITQVSVTVQWDVDGNGKVDVNDLIKVGQSLGQLSLGRKEDVNLDGSINILDMVLVAQHMS